MTKLRDYVSQYKNPELCAKWDNNIPASELQDGDYSLLVNFRDLESLWECFSFLPATDMTGALVTVADGDYGEVYVTESSRPYSLDAIYHPLDYYL